MDYNNDNFTPYQQQQAYQPQQYPQYAQQPQYAPYMQQPIEKKSSGMAITALVLGILGLLTFLIGGGVLSLIALILGIVSKKKQPQNNGMAVAGIVLGAVGLALSLIIVVLLVLPAIMMVVHATQMNQVAESIVYY